MGIVYYKSSNEFFQIIGVGDIGEEEHVLHKIKAQILF